MPYVPRISWQGVDLSGPVSYLTASGSPALNGTFGQIFFAEDTGQFWVCVGSGLWSVVAAPGTVAPGGAGSYSPLIKSLSALVDNTATNLCLVTIPNVIAGGGLGITVSGTLGDGDSTETSYWTVAFSRVAGANAKATISSKSSASQTTGAAGNAAVTISNTAVGGAVGAVNTFQMQAKVARSAGSAAGHQLTAIIEVINNFGGGITVA
jgi:hypothetical protein